MIVGPDAPELRSELVDAIHGNQLASWADTAATASDSASHASEKEWHTAAAAAADGERRRVAIAVRAACRQIRSLNEGERDRLVGLLRGASIVVSDSSVSEQRHTVAIEVAPAEASRAAEILHGAGYRSSRAWGRGALESVRRSADSRVLTRDGTATTVVQLRWNKRRRGRLQQLFGPTPADWAAVDLPAWLWWGYSVVRPARLLAERLGLRSRDHSALEPFLVTPESLIVPLLEVACVSADDVVFDFGSGDGRFVVAAAAACGCRAIGVEQSAELCAAAVERAAEAGVSGRVRIVNDDAGAVDLSEVTVVVLFLPMVVAARVVPDLMARLPSGARIVLHEQTALAAEIPQPDTVHAVVVDDAVTVANRWLVGG